MNEVNDAQLGDWTPQQSRDAIREAFDAVVTVRGSGPRGTMPRNIGAMGDSDYRDVVPEAETTVLMSRAQIRARDEYDPERANRLAEEYSEGSESLRAIHTSDPHNIPPPLVIRRWRREHPEFDVIMADARRVKAESMMEETLEISSERDYNVAKNKMAARHKLAAAYDRDVFGETQTLLGDRNRPLMVGASATAGLSDEELLKIAGRGKLTGLAVRPPTEPATAAIEPRAAVPLAEPSSLPVLSASV